MSETYGNLNGQPVVEVDKLTQGRVTQSVIESCPLCGEKHTHGFSENLQKAMHSNASVPSHRSAHCGGVDGVSGYYLIVTNGTQGAEIIDGQWQYGVDSDE
jgi:hypothetical protein